MRSANTSIFYKGFRDGTTLFLGYAAVGFTLGIGAKGCGLSPFQAFVSAITQNASAGQFAGYSLIASGAGLLEVAVMILIANARYLLMSCTLSQKLPQDTPMIHRMGMALDITDEIFGLAAAQAPRLSPFYSYGLAAAAAPGWAFGTYIGAAAGGVLPADVMAALSVSLFGMFIAVIVPPARKDKLIAALIAVSMGASWFFTKFNVFELSGGMRTMVLTIVIAGAAGFFFPIKEHAVSTEPEPSAPEAPQLHAA